MDFKKVNNRDTIIALINKYSARRYKLQVEGTESDIAEMLECDDYVTQLINRLYELNK